MQSKSLSLHLWFNLLAPKQEQYMQRENVIFILLIGPEYLYMPFTNW